MRAGQENAAGIDQRSLAFTGMLEAAGGVIERVIDRVVFRATLDRQADEVIFTARSAEGPWPVVHAESFAGASEAFFEGWCMDVGQWIAGIKDGVSALAASGGDLADREEMIRAATPALQETEADFRLYRPSRRALG